MGSERRSATTTTGRRIQVHTVIPPDLASIALDHAPGPRSKEVLARAEQALARWKPPARASEAEDVERTRRARQHRRGESLDGQDALLNRAADELTTVDVARRIRAAEQQAREIARARDPITSSTLASLHATLVGSDFPEPWRRDVVWLGGIDGPSPEIRMQPTAPERIPASMAALEAFLARDGNVVMQAALAFAQLPVIHPWRDGNGRTGRLLGDLVLARGTATGEAPHVSDLLATRWHLAMVGMHAWLVDGRLDEWVALYAAAVETAARSPKKRRMFRR